MNLPVTVRFSPIQRTFVAHRLSVPDVLADAFCDHIDNAVTRVRAWDMIESEARTMAATLEETLELKIETTIQAKILIACLEGSTLSYEEMSSAQKATIRKLRNWLQVIFDQKITFPWEK